MPCRSSRAASVSIEAYMLEGSPFVELLCAFASHSAVSLQTGPPLALAVCPNPQHRPGLKATSQVLLQVLRPAVSFLVALAPPTSCPLLMYLCVIPRSGLTMASRGLSPRASLMLSVSGHFLSRFCNTSALRSSCLCPSTAFEGHSICSQKQRPLCRPSGFPVGSLLWSHSLLPITWCSCLSRRLLSRCLSSLFASSCKLVKTCFECGWIFWTQTLPMRVFATHLPRTGLMGHVYMSAAPPIAWLSIPVRNCCQVP